MAKKAVLLDRDGTLIVDRVYLDDSNLIEYLPGVFEALRLLRDHGYLFFVVTNQSGVARGIVQIENLYHIHAVIRADFAREGVDIANFYYAPYLVDSPHNSRKPNPGMLLHAARDYDLDLRASWMVGDRWVDVEAGRRAGARQILLAGTENPVKPGVEPPTAFVSGLMAAAEFIVRS